MLKVYKAKWILPANGQVIEDGAILVKNGKIFDVIDNKIQDQCFVDQDEDFLIDVDEIIDYKNAVITPGFINLHTHLQYTDLKSSFGNMAFNNDSQSDQESSEFVRWIIELIKQYSAWNIQDKIKSVQNGIDEVVLAGTTCIAQMSKADELFYVFNDQYLRSYIFLETFSNSEETSKIEFLDLKEKIRKFNQEKSGRINIGISPHSVYNVHPVLWRMVSEFAAKEDILVQSHFAESVDEINWIKNGFSAIDLIHKFVGWDKVVPFETGLNPVQFMKKLGILSILKENLTLAHLNQLDNDLFEELYNCKTNIVYCPRSNIILHHKTMDLEKIILSGFSEQKIGIGTDSRFSNYDLSLVKEAKFIESNTNLGLFKLLDMLTINAAKILKLDDKIGSLEKDKEADFLVFKLRTDEDYHLLFKKDAPNEVFIQGKHIVQDKKIILNANKSYTEII